MRTSFADKQIRTTEAWGLGAKYVGGGGGGGGGACSLCSITAKTLWWLQGPS